MSSKFDLLIAQRNRENEPTKLTVNFDPIFGTVVSYRSNRYLSTLFELSLPIDNENVRFGQLNQYIKVTLSAIVSFSLRVSESRRSSCTFHAFSSAN